MSQTQRIVRCAIYTRKSSEEGLEQEFNSLDAQYEACSAYVVSQKSEGWKRTPVRYDDGGISGGTLERPALRRLLADIEAGRVDLVVVYKIDRLTRSLMDFSKLVERFDKSNCSFVSVTQAFNTSTSMGRLTLNVLLSFAQFEREVTAERIRDKIAASKKKGMWMGGIPPIGYTTKDKELIVDPEGAKIVNRIFEIYLEVKCLNRLKREIDKLGYETRPSRPGSFARPYSRGHLYNMLCNPIYVGEIRHKDQRFPGRHEGIVDHAMWDRVQTLLEGNSQTVRGKGRRAGERSPLTGRLFDETGDRLTPSYTKKNERRIRYFVSNRLVDRSSTRTPDPSGWRLPATQLEEAVAAAISGALKNAKAANSADVGTIKRVTETLAHMTETGKGRLPELLDLVARVRVTPGMLEIELHRDKLASIFEASAKELPIAVVSISAPFQRRRRGIETKLVYGYEPPKVDAVLLRRVARGYAWWDEIKGGKATFKEIVKREKLSRKFVAIHIDLAFLTPVVVTTVLAGGYPSTLSAQSFRSFRLPDLWLDQQSLLATLTTRTVEPQ
ncbi:MAG: recombinase family protein [Hyphomonadaceae bacterium]